MDEREKYAARWKACEDFKAELAKFIKGRDKMVVATVMFSALMNDQEMRSYTSQLAMDDVERRLEAACQCETCRAKRKREEPARA